MCLQGSDFDFKGKARPLTHVRFFNIQGQVHTSENHTIPHQKWKKIHIFSSLIHILLSTRQLFYCYCNI